MNTSSRKSGKRRALLLATLSFSLLLPATLLWLFAAPFAGWVAGQYLDTLDLELRRLEQLELRLDGFDLAGLALAGEALALDAAGISAEFALPRIARIDIAELSLRIPTGAADSAGTAPDIAATLLTLRELPVGVLDIAEMRLAAGEIELAGRLRASTAPLRVEWHIESPWPLALRLTSPAPDNIGGAISAAQGLRAEFEGEVAGGVIEGALEASLTPREITELFGIDASLPAGSMTVGGPFSLNLAETDFTFAAPHLDLRVDELALGDLPAIRADLRLGQVVARYWRASAAEAGRWYALGYFNAPALELPWLAPASLDGSLQLSGGGLRGTATIATGALASDSPRGTGAPATGTTAGGDLDGTGALANRATAGDSPRGADTATTGGNALGIDNARETAVVAAGAMARANIELLHRFDDGAGFADIEVPEFRFSDARPLSSLLSLELPQGDVIAGSIAGAGGIEWSGGDFEGGMLLRLADLSGFFAETALFDLDTDIEIELTPDFGLRNAAPLAASLARVDPGLPLEDLHWNYNFDSASGVAEIRQLQAALLGGTISLPSLRLDRGQLETGQPAAALNLVLSEVDLAEVTGLANYDELAVTGRISGYLPVRIEPGGIIRIEDGLVGALRPGGTIRYTPRRPASDARMRTVHDFLSDYHFETLNSHVQLDANGDLRLQTEIVGANPAVNPDQPINLNVNIVDNIPELLRSLRAGREISRMLEEQLNRR